MNTLMWLEKSVGKQDIAINQLATFASSKTKYGVYGVLLHVGWRAWVGGCYRLLQCSSHVGLLVLCCVGLGA